MGREPHDTFEETNEDMTPLQKLELRMQQQIDDLKTENREIKVENREMKAEIQNLRSRLDTVIYV